MDLFKEIAKLTRALLADEDSTFSVYFAQTGSKILYKLFIKNEINRDYFSCALELNLTEALSLLVAGLNNQRDYDETTQDVSNHPCYNGLFTPLDSSYMIILKKIIIYLDLTNENLLKYMNSPLFKQLQTTLYTLLLSEMIYLPHAQKTVLI